MHKVLDIRHRNVPQDLAWGHIQIKKFDRFQITEMILSQENFHDSIVIRSHKEGQESSYLRITYYYQDASQSDDYRNWYGPDGNWAKSKKWIKLSGGMRFEPHMLAIKAMHPDWRHRTILHKKGCFSHHYEREDQILVVTYRGDRLESMLDYPLFSCIASHLSIASHNPVQEIQGFDYKEPDHGIIESPLPDNWRMEIVGSASEGMKTLDLNPEFEPNFSSINAIHLYILGLRKRRQKLSKDEKEQLAINLGSLWGQAVCNTREWVWALIKYPDVPEALPCIVRTDRCYAIAPMTMLNEMLSQRSAERTGLLLYNMIGHKDEWTDEIPNMYQMLE